MSNENRPVRRQAWQSRNSPAAAFNLSAALTGPVPNRRQTPEHWAEILNFPVLEWHYGLPGGMMMEILRIESQGDPNALGPLVQYEDGRTERPVGLFQILPSTARRLGVNPRDPVQAAEGAARYLASHVERYWQQHAERDLLAQQPQHAMQFALASYNWGRDKVEPAMARRGADWLRFAPSITREYIHQIMDSVDLALMRVPDAAPKQVPDGDLPRMLDAHRVLEPGGMGRSHIPEVAEASEPIPPPPPVPPPMPPRSSAPRAKPSSRSR